MNSLVKVPPYSKLNFQGQIFFAQNWCNITLITVIVVLSPLILTFSSVLIINNISDKIGVYWKYMMAAT
jgi:hypothetical protein